MDIRKYFQSTGSTPTKIKENNNNNQETFPKKEQKILKDHSKSIKHENTSELVHKKSKSVFGVEENKRNSNEIINEEKTEKEEYKNKKVVEEKYESFKERKKIGEEKQQMEIKKIPKVKEKLQTNVKKEKKKEQQKKLDAHSDSNELMNVDKKKKTKHKRNTKITQKLSQQSSYEQNFDDDDDDDCLRRKKSLCVSKRSSDKLEEQSQSKRKRFKSESEDDFHSEKHGSINSLKSKKIKKQVLSDGDSDDMTERIHKKQKKRIKKSACISDSDSGKEIGFQPKQWKACSMFSESDEEKRASKSPIRNFFKPRMTIEENITADKPKKSPLGAKSVSACDFFGSSAVQRTERKLSSSMKRNISESYEDEFHDDDDFAATLELLDKHEEEKTKLENSGKNNSPDVGLQQKTGSEKTLGSGKAGKLPIKMKMDTLGASEISPRKANETPPSEVTKENDTLKPDSKKINIPETPVHQQSAYRNYLNREGPRALGSKEIPQGADNCLEGLTFVITGVLESIERDEVKSLIERYGGKVTGSLSGKTSYIIVGREAGESKLKKAISLKTTQLDEDGLFNLIRTKPGKKSKYLIKVEETMKKEAKKGETWQDKSKMESPSKTFKKSPQKPVSSVPSSSSNKSSSKCKESKGADESLLWVDKYKPKSLKQVIGQNGDKSNAKKLMNWLKNWHSNREVNLKPSNRFFGINDTGAGMKAALLSGPPGVGKTTTAHLVCQESGFSAVEMNASDTRSKSSLQSEVKTLLQNSSLLSFYGNAMSTLNGKNHCLIMDEVDGMAGNEDRGGVAELIQLIKFSKIPIICLCNDRQHPKIRSLVNYCFDLRFHRPRVEQIKAAMMTVAFKEGLKISPPALDEIIVAANQDIRQIIHNLSMLTSTAKNLSYDEAKLNAQKAKKDMKLGPFDICRQVFIGGEETHKMSINDKADLFFHDYQLTPLFVQENYPSVHPYAGRYRPCHHLSLLAHTAESICNGDLVERLIRQQQNWSLLPVEAMYASVFPGEYMRGNVSHMVSFPKWLGKFSSRNKNERILQVLSSHMRLCISSDKRGFNLDYLPCLSQHLIKPLQDLDKDGVPQVIKLMDSYDIIKEDYDNIMEFTKWPNTHDYSKTLSSSTKAAFTRAYNKESHMTPYSTGTLNKKRNKSTPVSDDFFGEGQAAAASGEEDDDADDIDIDTMIKKKKIVNQKGKKSEKKTKRTKEQKAKAN